MGYRLQIEKDRRIERAKRRLRRIVKGVPYGRVLSATDTWVRVGPDTEVLRERVVHSTRGVRYVRAIW